MAHQKRHLETDLPLLFSTSGVLLAAYLGTPQSLAAGALGQERKSLRPVTSLRELLAN